MTSQEDDLLRYRVILSIKHPSIEPSLITKVLNLTPNMCWMAGEDRRTPKGEKLPGKYKESAWGYSFFKERNRFFFQDMVSFLDRLEPHEKFISELIRSGGTISLIVQLPGDVNIGDVLKWQNFARLSKLQINVGIEVFPNFN